MFRKVARTLFKSLVATLLLLTVLMVATGALIKFSPRTIFAVVSHFSEYQIDAQIIETDVFPLKISTEKLEIAFSKDDGTKPLFRSSEFEATLNWIGFIQGIHNVLTVETSHSKLSLVNLEKKSDEGGDALEASNLHSYLSRASVDLSLLEIEIDANRTLNVDRITNSIKAVDGSDLNRIRSASELQQFLEFKLSLLDKNRTLTLTGDVNTVESNGGQQIKLQMERLDLRNWFVNQDDSEERTASNEPFDLASEVPEVSNTSLTIDLQELLMPQGKLSNLLASLQFTDSIQLSQLTGDIDIAINDQFQLNETLNLSGSIQQQGALVNTNLKASVGIIELILNAVVDPQKWNESQGNISVNLPAIPVTTRTEGASDLIKSLNPWLPISGAVSLNKDQDNTDQNQIQSWKANIHHFNAGLSDVTGEVSLDSAGKIEVQLNSELISILTNADKKEDEPTKKHSNKSLLLSDTPFNFGFSSDYSVSGSWLIQTMKIDQWKLEQITLPIELTDNQISISGMSFDVAGGQVNTSLDVTYRSDRVEQGELILSASKLDLEHLNLGEAGKITGGDTELTMQLSSKGSNLNALLEALDGHALLTIDNAKISNDAFEVIGSDLLLELLAKLNPFIKSDPTTSLECAVINLPIRQGNITVDKTIAIETAKMIMTANGKINLGGNSLKLELTPQARGGLGIDVGTLVKFIEVGGQVNAPKPAVGATGLLKSGVAVGAAISTGGASLLVDGLISKLAKGKACERALKIRPEPASQSSPSERPKTQEKDKSE